MTSSRAIIFFIGLPFILVLSSCSNISQQPTGLTPIPSLAPGATATLVSALQQPVLNVNETQGGGGEANAAVGAALFLKNCTPCHGNQGQGVSGLPLRNNLFIQTAGDQSIFDTIANGRPNTKMPAWLSSNGGPLSSTEITAVVSYLHTLQGVSPLPVFPEPTAEPTEPPPAPGEPTPEPARPSGEGGPGPAASMTGDPVHGRVDFGLFCAACHGPEGVQGVPNPGSEDGSVPPLNPIDPTIVNADPKIFAQNVDLFIEHGSVPDGDNPSIVMPAFGDSKMLTEQQIADIIAYVISLNGGK
jgi:mono/diheme cytochrome c family protein